MEQSATLITKRENWNIVFMILIFAILVPATCILLHVVLNSFMTGSLHYFGEQINGIVSI